MKGVSGSQATKLGISWLSNPVVVWGGSIAVMAALAYFFLPGLYSGAKKAFSAWVDDIMGGISSIIGSPDSQKPQERTRTDNVTGLATQGDRALSDLVDSPFTWTANLLFGSKTLDASGHTVGPPSSDLIP